MAKQDSLDPQTRDLVRFAAAIAQGYEPELRERVGPLRASQVPSAWVEELILQSVLMVGYPRALIAFGVWRKFSGVPAPETDEGQDYGQLPEWTRRGEEVCARHLRRELPEAAGQCPHPASSHRCVDDHRGLRPHAWPPGARPPAARALHGGADGHSRDTRDNCTRISVARSTPAPRSGRSRACFRSSNPLLSFDQWKKIKELWRTVREGWSPGN